MKKTTATVALAAAVGFSALATTPAMAAPVVFSNCSEAAAYGVYNIPAGSPGYGSHLDRDGDGIGCENSTVVYDETLVPGYETPVAEQPEAPIAQQPTDAGTMPFKNCTEARNAGYTNIPSTSPFYGPHLDRDKDGFGCDAGGADEVDDVTPEVGDGVTGDWGQQNWEQGNWDQQWPAADQQVAQMPVGGADTGVAQESSNGAGALALGGGLALIAAAGAVFGIRRARA